MFFFFCFLIHFDSQNEQLDLIEVVTVVKRIASAVSYMQEFGICHSNISSHVILVGRTVTQVKLTSFELAVPFKSDIQAEVEFKSKEKENSKPVPLIRSNSKRSPKQSLSSEQNIERYKQLKNQHMSSEQRVESTYAVPFIREISTKYFPYCTEYRRKLTIFNYQAPELLSNGESFVFPTKQSDTYALTLLLWELLNKCIPFVIYDEMKLNDLLKSNYPLKYLPIVEEERCQRFHEIFERGLKREPETRIDLTKMIRKLKAIETEISRGNENDHDTVKCCCLKSQKTNTVQRKPSTHEPNNTLKDDTTPDKSIHKHVTSITSPQIVALSTNSIEKNMSPLNNVHRSILDFNRLLSPRRDTNDDTVLRTSTLKKKKQKIGPTKSNKRNVRDLFGDDVRTDGRANEESIVASIIAQDSEPLSSGRPSNEFNNAIFQSAISKDLEYTHVEEAEQSMKENRPANKKIEQPFGPKEVSNDMDDTKASCANNSYRFIIDDYELPQELIARNNKIQRCTWLSSNLVNDSQLQTKHDDALSTLNESNDSSKKSVNIKIVHKKLSPTKNTSQNESIKSDCSTASAMSTASSEDGFSVKSRIKFFRSLESQPVHRRTPNKSKMNVSRRSEMSYNEAKKAVEKAQRNTYPSSKQPEQDFNQQLIKEITEITADIRNCLSKNKYLSEKKSDKSQANQNDINNFLNVDFSEADESIALLIDDLLNEKQVLDENSKNESNNEENEKRNSVRETVQKFESSLRNEKNDKSFAIQKIENKLLNEKVFNTDVIKSEKQKLATFFGNKLNEVTDEKIEDVIRFQVPSEADNESGAQYQPTETEELNTGEILR